MAQGVDFENGAFALTEETLLNPDDNRAQISEEAVIELARHGRLNEMSVLAEPMSLVWDQAAEGDSNQHRLEPTQALGGRSLRATLSVDVEEGKAVLDVYSVVPPVAVEGQLLYFPTDQDGDQLAFVAGGYLKDPSIREVLGSSMLNLTELLLVDQ